MGQPEPGMRVSATVQAFLVALDWAGFHVVLRDLSLLNFGSGVPDPAPFVALFLLTALAIPAVVSRWLRLTRGQLLFVCAVVLVGAPLISMGGLGWMLPMSIYQHYVARAIPEWERTFLHLVPEWFTPTDLLAVEAFFHGQSGIGL